MYTRLRVFFYCFKSVIYFKSLSKKKNINIKTLKLDIYV